VVGDLIGCKARILSAASKMVRERGVDATSVADVMEAAGMTNGGFYRHFQSKDEMIAMAIRAAFARVLFTLGSSIAAHKDLYAL
jgi:AcrR family transcriptional regulator